MLVLLSIVISISQLQNKHMICSSVVRHKDTGKYTIEFLKAGNYELLNSLEQCILLIRVGEKEKKVTLPLLAEDNYVLKSNQLKEKLEAME